MGDRNRGSIKTAGDHKWWFIAHCHIGKESFSIPPQISDGQIEPAPTSTLLVKSWAIHKEENFWLQSLTLCRLRMSLRGDNFEHLVCAGIE